ncbi:CPBP family intramembrane metalloprotease [Lysobacter sp. TY2-98]|uniref:CPBP family intramembrane glutamic endopeptidase n=1 Tax=Lysobacter sp. TY2-98 TaxID=2290922 RepID=UPI000E20B7B4|nr:CPBP family intramembrane glutamic endopeptidase [Lysobacter sp. TY2-98]AXK72893.1 CPBP family intramembrane metalloprotease [Lysobacter sp. TY2-98]
MSTRSSRSHARLALGVVALVYAAAFVVLMRMPGASVAEPLFLLAALVGVFPLLAWALTRRPRPVHTPRRRAPAIPVLAYLALFAVLVLGWGFSALNTAVPGQPAQTIAQTALKLITMTLLPAMLFLRGRRLPSRLSSTRLAVTFVVLSIAYLGFQAVFGRGLRTLAELAPSTLTLLWAVPACFAWETIEAGLCEEMLFRRVLQQRIEDATGSPVAAVAWASLLFGLAHAPGLWMRGGNLMEGVAHATPLWAIAYSIVMIAPAGVAFGVLWTRTRSLWLVVPLHGMVDLLPHLAPFIRDWTGVH